MDDKDIDDRFGAVEKLIGHTEKRFDDVKWYLGGAATLFTIGFSVLTLILSWNYNTEKAGLLEFERDIRTDIKTDLGKMDVPPDLEILGINRELLSGQEIVAAVEKDKDGSVGVTIDHILKNKGGTSTKVYYGKGRSARAPFTLIIR